MVVPKDIEDLRNHLYTNAGKVWWATWWIAIATQGLALVTIWIKATSVLALLALVILSAPVVMAWLRERDTQWESVNKAVAYAYEHAKSALYAEAWKDFSEANRQ